MHTPSPHRRRALLSLLWLLAFPAAAEETPTRSTATVEQAGTVQRSEASPAKEEVTKTQRIYELSPSSDAVDSLTESGVHSAAPLVAQPLSVATLKLTSPEARFDSMSAEQLAQAANSSSSLSEAVAAVQTALKRGGIDVTDGASPLISGDLPRAALPVTTVELFKMTLEQQAQGSYTATMEDLGQLLAHLGWPFADVSKPGKELQAFFSSWIQAAREKPDDVHSFVPLFLDASVRGPARKHDLTTAEASPDEIRLTLLEIELFLAAVERLVVPQSQESTSHEPISGRDVHVAATLDTEVVQLASLSPLLALTSLQRDGGPCGQVGQKVYGWLGWGKQSLERQAADFTFDQAIESAIKKALDVVGYAEGRIEKALGAVKVASQLMKVIGLYKNLPINVTVSREWVHKPLGDSESVDFTATLTTPKLPEGSREDPVGDCLAAAGLADMREAASQVAEAIGGFAVEWRLTKGSPEHVYDAPVESQPDAKSSDKTTDVYHLGRLRTGLRSGPNGSFTSTFKVQVNTEKPAEHPSLIIWEPAVACAAVDTTVPPTVSTLAGAVTGPAGYASSIAELILGMIQKMAKPQACGLLKVHFCERYTVRLSDLIFLDLREAGMVDVRRIGAEGTVPIDRHDGETFAGEATLEWSMKGRWTGSEGAVALIRGSAPMQYKVVGWPGEKPRTVEMDWISRRLDASGTVDFAAPDPRNIPFTLPDRNETPCLGEDCTGFTIDVYPGSSRAWTVELPGAKSEIELELLR